MVGEVNQNELDINQQQRSFTNSSEARYSRAARLTFRILIRYYGTALNASNTISRCTGASVTSSGSGPKQPESVTGSIPERSFTFDVILINVACNVVLFAHDYRRAKRDYRTVSLTSIANVIGQSCAVSITRNSRAHTECGARTLIR